MGSCISKREPTFSIGRICQRHPWPSSAASRAAQGRSPSPSPSQKPSQKPPQKPPQKPSPKLSPKPSQKPSQESSQTPSQYLAWAEEALQKRRVAERGRAWTRDEETEKWSKCATHASKEEMEGLGAPSQKPWQKPRVWMKDEETGKRSKCAAHASSEEMEGPGAPSQKPLPPSPSPWAAAFRAVQERSPSPSSESEGFLATARTSHVTSTSAQGPGDQDGPRPAASCAAQGCSPLPTSQSGGFLDEDFAYDSDECEALEIKLMQDTATESSGHFPAISNQVARQRALTLMEKETDEDRRVQDQFRAAAHIRNGADDKYLRKNTKLEMNGADEAIPVLSSSPEDVVSAPVAVE